MPIVHAPHGRIATPEIKFADNTVQTTAAATPFLDVQLIDGAPMAPSISLTMNDITNKFKIVSSAPGTTTEVLLSAAQRLAVPIGTRIKFLKDPWGPSGDISFISDPEFPVDVLSNVYPVTLTGIGEACELIKVDDWTWYVKQNKISTGSTGGQSSPFTQLAFTFADPGLDTTLSFDATIFKKFKFAVGGQAFFDFPLGLQDGDELTFLFTRDADYYNISFDPRYRWDLMGSGFQPAWATSAYNFITATYEASTGLLFCRQTNYMPPGYGY